MRSLSLKLTVMSLSIISFILFWASSSSAQAVQPIPKEMSVFYPKKLIGKAKVNAERYPWAAEIQKHIIESAEPWMEFSDDELWDLMFGSTIRRSWMVWSNGHCPVCKNPVPMYNWKMDALKNPWKVSCPHCGEVFPKNNFHKFYRSGLDEHAIFAPELADRTLLFNVEHPDPEDPLHGFGVDDGEGYVEGDNRWRFIGAYLIYGQWKQAVLGGIRNLAAAYVVTGDGAYAHKAAVLLDRVADLYPTFDFKEQGVMYEGPGYAGYVSTWHDACEETREMALAYDQIFDALERDSELVDFLARKAEQYKLSNPKTSFEDVRRNIEDRILRDAIENRWKIRSNYPRTDIAIAVMKTVLSWPDNRDEVYAMIDDIIKKFTAVDGVTGEKGLAGYSAFATQGLAVMLGQYARLNPNFLGEVFDRNPQLHQTYRFHIDTWCLQKYYPLSGDTGSFARSIDSYVGVRFSKNPGLNPSMYTLLWQLYELTGDEAFVQVLYRANGGSVDDLPHDLSADDPDAFQKAVSDVIADKGSVPRVGSVNKQAWHLAILRAGEGDDARALWLDYDAWGGHGHADGMNLGLFAKGLDLMPDFGYPPVQYGGWGAPRAVWYTMSAAHNTVVVDGQNQPESSGETTLWADGGEFRAIRASAPDMIGGKQFERTVSTVDISDRDFYIVDVFRVIGGSDHAKFMHSHFGEITAEGLSLEPTDDYGYDTQMRRFCVDPAPQPGWSVDWKIEDRYRILPSGSNVHLRYTDLTLDAQASIAEAWISMDFYGSNNQDWIPRVMVRRQTEEDTLASTFVAIIEPYEGRSNIARIQRLPLEAPDGTAYPEPNVAVEVELADGRRDLFVAVDVENPLGLSPSKTENGSVIQREWGLQLDGDLCLVRLDNAGEVKRIALCQGKSISVGRTVLKLKGYVDFIEISLDRRKASMVSSRPEAIQEILIDGRNIWR